MSSDSEKMPSKEMENKRSNLQIWTIMTALFLALFVGALDQSIVATAIPTISSDLHSASGYQWIGGAYLLSNAAFINIWANLSDIWGRKIVLLIAAGLFFVSSIICATAVDVGMLIAGRVLQGAAGGGLIQLVTITISDLFSLRRRSLMLGLTEVVWAVAGAAGPIIGGAFTQSATWRWIFWINLPISGIAFILILFFLDVHDPKTPILDGIKAIDWCGGLSILGFTLMLLLGLDFGGATFPWDSATVICLIVFGVLMIPVFLCAETWATYPMVPLRVFTTRSNIACLVVSFAHGFVFLSIQYYLPLYFQSTHSATPLTSGLYSLPFLIAEAISAMICGIIVEKTGHYLLIIWTGLACLVAGTGSFIDFTVHTGLGKIIGYQIIAGVGSGFLLFPPLIALQSNISQKDTATATATMSFARILAEAMAIVIGGVVFQNGIISKQDEFREVGLSGELMGELSGGNAAANVLKVKDISDGQQREVVEEAFAWSMKNMWIMYTVVAGVGLVGSVLIKTHVLGHEHTETRTGLKDDDDGNE